MLEELDEILSATSKIHARLERVVVKCEDMPLHETAIDPLYLALSLFDDLLTEIEEVRYSLEELRDTLSPALSLDPREALREINSTPFSL